MSSPSPPGVAFLDLLASALIALLIVYLTAPEEQSPNSHTQQAAFSLQGSQDPHATIVVCLSLRSRWACSTDGKSKYAHFYTNKSGAVVASWSTATAGVAPKAWVSLYTIGEYPQGDLQVVVNSLGSSRRVVVLSRTSNYSNKGISL